MKNIVVLLVALVIAGCASLGSKESMQLIDAVKYGHTDQVKSMIAAGVDVNELGFDIKDGRGWMLTPIIEASIWGNVEIMKILLDAGANVNIKDNWGDTALMATAAHNHFEAAKLLIASGADVDATKPDMTTALMIAARHRNFKIVEILLESEADVNIGLGSGDTALSLAVISCNISSDKAECLPIIKALIEKGAVVNQTDKDGQTLLDRSIMKSGDEITTLLIESGADVRAGHPLTKATYYGNSNLVKLIIKNGVDVNEKAESKSQITKNMAALHLAAISGPTEILQILLGAGADINMQTGNGDTALIFASKNGHNDVVKTLVNSGADLNIRNKNKSTALKVAQENGWESTMKLLENAGAKE